MWRTEARCCLPPGHSPARAGLARAATASAEPGPAHTLVELECLCGFSESVGSGPFFCSFDARILVEALRCARKTRWRTVLPQHFGGSYSDFFLPLKSPPCPEEALDPAGVRGGDAQWLSGFRPWGPGRREEAVDCARGSPSETSKTEAVEGARVVGVRVLLFGSRGSSEPGSGNFPRESKVSAVRTRRDARAL